MMLTNIIIHSDLIYPSSLISDVTTEITFETRTVGAETRLAGAQVEVHQDAQLANAGLADRGLGVSS